MSANISNVVQVTISRETQAVTKTGFGTGLILGSNASWVEYSRTYETIDEVLDDFSTSDDEYKAAVKYFGQEVKPPLLKIGKRATPVKEEIELDLDDDFVTGNTIDMKIKGVSITQVPFNSTHGTTMTDLATEIALSDYVSTATVTGANQITLVAQTAGVPQDPTSLVIDGGASQPNGAFTTSVENVGAVEDLVALSLEDNDWYGLILTDRDPKIVAEVAEYIEARRKLFFTTSDDSSTLDAADLTDIGAILEADNIDRTSVYYDSDPADFAEAGWVGRMFPLDAGSATWKFKTLAGITASSLSSSERNAALGKNVNLMTEIGGVDITEEGTVASGEFIDVMRGVDWLQARMEERIYERLVNLDKIPYTDGGVAIIEAEIRSVLLDAINQGILADDPAPTVTVPKVADIDQADKAARLLPDVEFEATLAGAIHKVLVQGRVSV